MRVIVDEGVFDDGDPLDVIALIRLGCELRHDVLLSPTFARTDALEGPRSRFFAAQGEGLRERIYAILEICAERASRRSQRVPTIHVSTGPSQWRSARLAIGDAIALLSEPLRIMMEGRSDRHFLAAMVPRSLREEFEHACRQTGPNWIEFDAVGGLGDLKARLDALRSAADDERCRAQMRTWVMFDRDADPKDPRKPSAESRAVAELCRDSAFAQPWPLPSLQLGRRSIENYLPLEVLRFEQWRVDALERLRNDYPAESFGYAMKEGFIKDELRKRGDRDRDRLYRDWQHAESSAQRFELVERGLLPRAWQDLPDDLLGDLLFGFGSSISDTFVDCHPDDFASEYGRGPETQRAREDVINEILELL